MKAILNRLLVVLLAATVTALSPAAFSQSPAAPQEPASGAHPWTPSADCSQCHAKYVASLKDETLLANNHAKSGFDKCSDCHSDDDALRAAHTSGSVPPVVIMARRYPKEFCLRCHGTLADLATQTANSKVLTDIKGRTINPHALPDNPAHKKAGECANCHRMHRPSMDAQAFCFGCHHTHEYACKSCHANR